MWLQVVTAVLLLRAIKQPLRKSSTSPGLVPDVQWRIPSPTALLRFLIYAGPICGVLVTKTVCYQSFHPPPLLHV